MAEPQSHSAPLLPAVRTLALAAAPAMQMIGGAASSSNTAPSPPAATQPMTSAANGEEPQANRQGSPLFPFSCPPLQWLGLPESFWKVQDCLHFQLVCGVVASVGYLFIVVLGLVLGFEASACGAEGLWCYAGLVCTLIIVPSTCRFWTTIAHYDERTQKLKEMEQRRARLRGKKQAELVAVISEQIISEGKFADEMTQKFFKKEEKAMQLFLKNFERQHTFQGVTVTPSDVFPHFKEFVANWVRFLGKARLAHLLREDVPGLINPVDKHCEQIMKADSIQGVTKAWTESMKLVIYPNIQNFMQAAPSACVVQETTERDLEAGSWSASWLQCRGGEGPQPECCAIQKEDGLDQSTFRQRKLHVLGACSVKILSSEHVDLLSFLLLDICVIIFEVFIPGMEIALDVVFINSVCILSMLLCFEQINAAEIHARRVQKIDDEIARLEVRKAGLEESYNSREAYHDGLSFYMFPILELMSQVEQKYQLADAASASAKAEELFDGANRCLKNVEAALGDFTDFLGSKRLSDEWKQKVGAALKALSDMQTVEDASEEEVLNKLLEHLDSGTMLAPSFTPAFVTPGAADDGGLAAIVGPYIESLTPRPMPALTRGPAEASA